MRREKLLLAAALLAMTLLAAATAAVAADARRSNVPTGLHAREAAEKALRACYIDCRQRSTDSTARENCMNRCAADYPHATSLQPKSERTRR